MLRVIELVWIFVTFVWHPRLNFFLILNLWFVAILVLHHLARKLMTNNNTVVFVLRLSLRFLGYNFDLFYAFMTTLLRCVDIILHFLAKKDFIRLVKAFDHNLHLCVFIKNNFAIFFIFYAFPNAFMKDFETVILLFPLTIYFWLFNWFKPWIIFLRKLQSHFRPFSSEWREEGWCWFFPLLDHVSVFVILYRLCNDLQIVLVVCLLGKLDQLSVAHGLTRYRLE